MASKLEADGSAGWERGRSRAPPAAPSPSPSSSSGSATPTAVAFVGDSTFDFQEDAWEEELARRTPRVLIKWRVNGETTEAFARRVRREEHVQVAEAPLNPAHV